MTDIISDDTNFNISITNKLETMNSTKFLSNLENQTIYDHFNFNILLSLHEVDVIAADVFTDISYPQNKFETTANLVKQTYEVPQNVQVVY